MSFVPPLDDLTFTLKHTAGLRDAMTAGRAGDLTEDVLDAVLAEAGKFAAEVIAPLNQPGDRIGARFENGSVVTAPGWKEAYRAWTAAGWNGLTAAPQWGGQGLPHAVGAACTEMWNAASMAFGVGPMLTMAAVDALAAHGSEELKARFLPKLVSGAWMGTMQLTEPQAGSDLGALRTRAERAGDGTYRLFGQKIYITYGEHDLTDNIVHLVLARLPDAPPGHRGISLFLVPKWLPAGNGGGPVRNDVRCHAIEHKLGIHGSPTCTMIHGDDGGAVGWLVGEENRGLACMFTMMNNARLAVGLQGVGVAERATQQALAYARERRQGRAPGHGGESAPIIAHPDVKRMLLTMRALTAAARAICYRTAAASDAGETVADERARRHAQNRAALLTPVAKAFATEIGVEVASLGIQVHGGMGYVEETGAAQHLRDARISPIYEGTNGIQAVDLVTRKLTLDGGETVRAFLGELRESARAVAGANDPAFGATGARLTDAVEALERATGWFVDALDRAPEAALAGASPYLRLFGTAAGGCALAEEALTARALADRAGTHAARRTALARFFAENLAPAAGGLERAVVDGGDSVNDAALG